MSAPSLQDIVSLSKRRGFVYPTSQIYGGLANSYDYAPLGVELLRKIKDLWWKQFITHRQDMIGLDSQIMLHPQTWVASGHVGAFHDPLVEDVKTNERFRADHLIEAWLKEHPEVTDVVVEDLTLSDMATFIADKKILSPKGNALTEPKAFNLLFETEIGAVSGEKAKVYLRGETAQGIFSNFKNILDSTRVQLPFGVGQIGKSFRNEITTGQFVFRTLEFEQAEIEYFFDPEQTDWQQLLEQWKTDMWAFFTETLGIEPVKLRWRKHTDKERSHYSKDTYDLEYEYPFGWKEVWGVAYRTDYDLKQHMKFSGESLEYRDPHTQKAMVPHVIEPAVGVNRVFLMVLCDAYAKDGDRMYLNFSPALSPYQVAVFPLVKNKEEIVGKAQEVYKSLQKNMAVYWDDRGNIGKRYLYQDEMGTPACVTIDYQTLEDQTVTVRDRNTTAQERVEIVKLATYLQGVRE